MRSLRTFPTKINKSWHNSSHVIAWAVITISVDLGFLSACTLRRGIAVPRFAHIGKQPEKALVRSTNTIFMKRTFFIAFFLLVTISSYAQLDVTQFLGLPVDGSKANMIQKLEHKGFIHSIIGEDDVLTGEFNGTDVNIFIVTNKNKVCRIVVCDANAINEASIRIRFNILCEQFKNNKNYFTLGDHTIPEDEDISYEMAVNSKLYEAIYYQVPASIDSASLVNETLSLLQEKYTPEQLEQPTEEVKTEIMDMATSVINNRLFKKPVWFRIISLGTEYGIAIYYDNEYNRAQGEDL